MDLHIVIRPKNKPTNNIVKKAGCIQFNRYHGRELRALGTATIWWKSKYIHARADPTHSVVTIDIPPNEFSRQLHNGFTLEILKNSLPIFSSEWRYNPAIINGFYLRINIEALQNRERELSIPLATVYTRHPGLYPSNQEVYYN